jgi:hypothetical protein
MSQIHKCGKCHKVMKTPNRWMLCIECRGKQCPNCQKWHDRSQATHCRMCEDPVKAQSRLIAESRKRQDIKRKRETARLKAEQSRLNHGGEYE